MIDTCDNSTIGFAYIGNGAGSSVNDPVVENIITPMVVETFRCLVGRHAKVNGVPRFAVKINFAANAQTEFMRCLSAGTIP